MLYLTQASVFPRLHETFQFHQNRQFRKSLVLLNKICEISHRTQWLSCPSVHSSCRNWFHFCSPTPLPFPRLLTVLIKNCNHTPTDLQSLSLSLRGGKVIAQAPDVMQELLLVPAHSRKQEGRIFTADRCPFIAGMIADKPWSITLMLRCVKRERESFFLL